MEPGSERPDEKNLEKDKEKSNLINEKKEETSRELRAQTVEELTNIEKNVLVSSSSYNQRKEKKVVKLVEEKTGEKRNNDNDNKINNTTASTNNDNKKKKDSAVFERPSFQFFKEKVKPVKPIKRPTTIGNLLVAGLDSKNFLINEDKPDKSKVVGENFGGKAIRREEVKRDGETSCEKKIDRRKSPLDRLEESRSKIKVLQDNLGTRIQAITALSYNEELSNRPLRSSIEIETNQNLNEIKFDSDFLERQRLEERLEIEEKRLTLDKDLETKPRYCRKVSEIEKRWSGEFLQRRSGNENRSEDSSSSESSYVEEFGSVSSQESIVVERSVRFSNAKFEEDREAISSRRRASVEFFEGSTVSTLGSDSGLDEEEKKLASAGYVDRRSPNARSYEEDPSRKSKDRSIPRESGRRSETVNKIERRTEDGYAKLIREFTMEPGVSRLKKEEKQKKKSGLRRLLPGFFSPKDSRKDYNKKKERKERRKQDERHFARYQQNGNYTRSPDTMNLNEDIKRNVKLDNSLNGSIIEERLDEIKRELFPDQGLITSTPDHFSENDEGRKIMVQASKYRAEMAPSNAIAEDVGRWYDRKVLSSDDKRYEERRMEEDAVGIKPGLELENGRSTLGGQLERKHSLQEANRGGRAFFQRNHGPSGRISAPPAERYFSKSRLVRPIDRPLPAIPRARVELSNYENYEREECQEERESRAENYENELGRRRSATVVVDTSNDRTGKYSSPGSSQKSGDYADSCCTPNSSQKSEFSPSSSKSGEYYLNSPRTSARTSPSAQNEGIYANETRPTKNPGYPGDELEERVYDETPPSPLGDAPDIEIERKRNDADTTSNRIPMPSKKGSSSSPRGASRKAQPSDQILIASPKREVIYERRTFGNIARLRPESPITTTMCNVPKDRVERINDDGFSKMKESQGQRNRDNIDGHRSASLPPFSTIPTASGSSSICTMKNLQRPEPVYAGSRLRSEPGACRRNVNDSSGPTTTTTSTTTTATTTPTPTTTTTTLSSLSVSSQEKLYTSKGSLQREPISDRQRARVLVGESSRMGNEVGVYHGQGCPISCNPASLPSSSSSPSKRRTMQHLEAFYWQQKALEAHRKTGLPVNNESLRVEPTRDKQPTSHKINLPEIREAVYWQQLKKLDEEQQRRIYERNLMEESRLDSARSISNRPVGRSSVRQQPTTTSTDATMDRSYWSNEKTRPAKTGNPLRPNLMHGQKGSTQPILIVRPQQHAIRDRQEIPIKSVDDRSRLSPRRSKSASPHLRVNRNVNKSDGIIYNYEDDNDCNNDGNKQQTARPHPIFKRGSLVSSDSVEYSTTGTKRVSFSNQNVGTELSNGNWPTKHGTASEPPTRRHRSDDSVSDTDSVFIRDPNLDIVYTGYPTTSSCSRNLEASYGYHRTPRNNDSKSLSQEYDADRPLPPLPKEPNVGQGQRWNVPPNNYRKWPALCESESGSEAAGEVQRIFGRSDVSSGANAALGGRTVWGGGGSRSASIPRLGWFP
ncbi:hypothetical protein HZH68_013581 [Vespula germanica]|uniref:Uncharacterized protein n=1 Tax=Vespula germanica TaxID=30212 RepID=A0A834MWQ1_VESGE|nr:hypothetical protein HZH68_013581 [Vespula germanica]